ncbi:spore gernimation protein [Bacillus sp. AFS002410]|uniref:GerAB/ArcD/ProY family transporter n=1 Tax=Bacillus sp. AFS002410 TaxID=2033481 RepID=UPI000BEF37BF|nr:GerAB/ArcD/ProY family transporter [Bacillus sp. AFS002410]PEJ51254.1 spore gernimation protein [Bacillus sp. AFS002410]
MFHLKKISLNQLVCLVILTQIGVHALSIPYSESRRSGYDSWMSILLGGVFAQLVIIMIYQLGKRYPNQSLQQYIVSIIGKPLGILVNILFAAYCAESTLMVIVSYADVMNRWVLFETPWFVLIGLSVFIVAFVAASSLRSIATLTQSFTGMFFVCLVIICISGYGKGDWRHFFPIGTHGIVAILKDSVPSLWAYAGYDLLLYAFPFVACRKKSQILLAMSVANGITTLIYFVISVIVTYNFSENQLNLISEPMVFILRKFRWPVVQSLDIVFMTIWLSVTTITAFVYLFLSARYLAFVGRKENHRHVLIVWLIASVVFGIGSFFADRQSLFSFIDFHNKTTFLFTSALPVFLLIVSFVRGKVAKE